MEILIAPAKFAGAKHVPTVLQNPVIALAVIHVTVTTLGAADFKSHYFRSGFYFKQQQLKAY